MLEQTHLIECDICGEEHDVFTLVNDKSVCESCYEDGEVSHCEECDELHYSGNLEEIDGELLCPDCLDRYTDVCQHCGERHFKDNLIYDNYSGILCEHCYYDYYVSCEECGIFVDCHDAIYRYDTSYCPECDPTRDILPYNEKPEPVFFGITSNHEFYGIELEVDANEQMDNEETAEHIHSLVNGEIYCKEDGSLDEGFEIVTHPCTFDHLMNMPWERIFSDLVEDGYRSHDIETCGLHIHVSRKAFGENPDTQEANIAKLLFIVERHWEKMVKFSRRTEAQLERWASSYLGNNRDITIDAKQLFEFASNSGRYHAVNLENYHTVELRLFRGTLKYNSFIATIQFVKLLKELVIEYSISELQTMTWNDIAVYLQKAGYEELNTYLKERNLNVPENVPGTQNNNNKNITA